ncbi:uncharacterized protein BYT42DRAFT_603224 [Radiomyces spectabilis]|uniref:uncharacterized protein n=1 Tax=Radiomyces spectabilis TaxID=64574 RepID=UPI00221FE3B6|nr:uncharacterized protein BYT42DRAFT_603224 [Radiomyces spectabilis]KAI8388791.1 hypothetical protein BYT42DRAFT_603224 [Radiomyces spectabilis]
MEDMYQYTAAAVNSNNPSHTNEVNEEDDPLLKAFTSFGWSNKFNSLVDTVKKQGEAFADVAKKDLQEFAQVLRDDSTHVVEQLTPRSPGINSETDGADPSAEGAGFSGFSAIRDNLNKINTLNLTALREGLSQTLNQRLPTQLTSVKLPDNINLEQLKEEMSQGTRFAEQYMQKFGEEVVQVLKKTVTVLEPEDEHDQINRSMEESQDDAQRPKIFATRKEALLAKMRSDPQTYLEDPAKVLEGTEQEEKDKKILDTFNATFNVQEYTDEIARLLDDHPDLRNIMDKLVPLEVNYATFWKRYFYHAWKIDQEEQKRQVIVKVLYEGAENEEDENDFKWDSDEEETEEKPVQPAKEKSDAKGSDTDYSNISEPASTEASLVSPPLKSQADGEDWVKTDPKKQETKETDEDSDSDWE